jgi:hypothetical protein
LTSPKSVAQENRPRGGAVGADDLERQADEPVLARLDALQVEAFDGDYPCAEERAVGVWVADRHVIEPDETDIYPNERVGALPVRYTNSCENSSRCQRAEFVALNSRRSAPARLVEAGRRLRVERPGDGGRVDDVRNAEERLEPELLGTGAPSMKWSGASMCVPEWTPKSSLLRLAASPSAIVLTRSRCTSGSPFVRDHPVPDRNADVDGLHRHATVATV